MVLNKLISVFGGAHVQEVDGISCSVLSGGCGNTHKSKLFVIFVLAMFSRCALDRGRLND